MSRLLRTDLPDDVWERLADEAAEHGVKIGVYVRRILTAHVNLPEPAPEPEPEPVLPVAPPRPPTSEQWARLNKWLASTGRHPDPSLLITTKSAMMAWAVGEGFQP